MARRHGALCASLLFEMKRKEDPMRILTTVLALLSATSAVAHPGHIIEVAGHDHWIAIGLIGAAGLAALLGKRKGQEAESDDDADFDGDEEPA